MPVKGRVTVVTLKSNKVREPNGILPFVRVVGCGKCRASPLLLETLGSCHEHGKFIAGQLIPWIMSDWLVHCSKGPTFVRCVSWNLYTATELETAKERERETESAKGGWYTCRDVEIDTNLDTDTVYKSREGHKSPVQAMYVCGLN